MDTDTATKVVRRQGKYRLLPPDSTSSGYFRLMHGKGENEFLAGLVSDPENFETAVDEADEEMRVLLAQAREEFGL